MTELSSQFNPAVGVPPTLEWVAVGAIGVDEVYQRGTDNEASQGLIRKIARFWDWQLCQPLSVTRRPDGSLWSVDGQHRLAAAKARGDIPHLPCVISRYDNVSDEAAAFVALNRQRKPLTAIDLFKAALASGDEEASAVMKLVRACGLSLAPHSNYTAWKPGMIACIPGVVRAVQRRGPSVARAAMLALNRAYPAEVLRYAGLLLDGLYDAYSSDIAKKPDFDDALFTRVLGATSQSDWVSAARVIQSMGELSRSQSMARAVLDRYRDAVGRIATVAPVRPIGVLSPVERSSTPLTDARLWCDQCDRSVSTREAVACRSTFCKSRPQVDRVA